MSSDSPRSSVVTLILHRDEETRRRLQRHLEHEGHIVLMAEEPHEALRTFFGRRPDATLIETDEGGLDLIRVLRAAADSTLLGLVEGNDAAQTALALDAGADDVVG